MKGKTGLMAKYHRTELFVAIIETGKPYLIAE